MDIYYPPAHPIVGVLGGMGPEATIDLMRRIMRATPAEDDGDHIHLIVDQNPKVPSRIDALLNHTGPSPVHELIRMAKGLEASGATMLAIACNTAHGYADDIAAAISIPLLNMITLTAEAVAPSSRQYRRVGMMASTAVLQLGIYERAFKAFDIETRYSEDQPEVMRLIKAVKKHGANAELRAQFNHLARAVSTGEVDLVVIACTELSLLADGLDPDIARLDAVDALVSAIVDRVRQVDSGSANTSMG